LGGGGGDPADAQFLQGAADLRGGHHALQFLGETTWRAGIAMKEAMVVGVGGARDTIALDEAAEQEEIAMRVFLRAKDAGLPMPAWRRRRWTVGRDRCSASRSARSSASWQSFTPA